MSVEKYTMCYKKNKGFEVEIHFIHFFQERFIIMDAKTISIWENSDIYIYIYLK